MKKRFFFVLILALMLGSLAFAGGRREAGSGDSEVPTIIWWCIGSSPEDLAEACRIMSDYTQEKIGVRFEIRVAGWGDSAQRFNTIVNTGEYFDIMFTDIYEYARYVSLGAAADLTDLVPGTAPQLWSFIPPLVWQGAKIRDRIYSVPTYKDSSTTAYHVWDDRYVQKYNIDITKTSYADLDNYFRIIKAGEGQRFYPMPMARGSNNYIFTNYDSLAAGLLPMGVRLDDTSRRVINTLEQPEVMDMLRYHHRWYQDGIINPDANLVSEGVTQRSFYKEQAWPGAEPILQAAEGVEKYDIARIHGPFYSTDSIQGSLNIISANSRHKEAALKLLELANTDHTFRDMLAYGIEGRHFQYVSPNVVHKNSNDWNLMAYQQATFFVMSTTDDSDPDQWNQIRRLNDSAFPSVMLGFALDTAPIIDEITNCKTVWNRYYYDLNTGAVDPDVVVPQLIAELKANGFDKVMAEAQRQVDAFK